VDDDDDNNNNNFYRWLNFGDSKGDTGSTTVAAKDQAISRRHRKYNSGS
jgi:hypothetical protein